METITKSVATHENYRVYGGVVCDLTVMSCAVSFALFILHCVTGLTGYIFCT